MNKLYILQYEPDNRGCPHFLSQRFDPEEWEWNGFEAKPLELIVTKDYTSTVTDTEIKFIDFDFYGTDTRYVSNEFVSLCKDLAVNSRLVPIDISLSDGSRPTKSYSVFLPADQLSILDPKDSIFEVETVKETGEIMTNRAFPELPIFSRIEKFVSKDIATPHLFQCIDIFSLLCTDAFRYEAIQRRLRGLKFTLLDENYSYDPWAGW